MKKWIMILGCFIILLVSGYYLLTYYAVTLIEPYIQKGIGHGFTLTAVRAGMTHLTLSGIRYEDPRSKQTFLTVDKVRIYPSLFSFLKQSVHIKKVSFLRPSLVYTRSHQGGWEGLSLGAKVPEREEANEKKSKERKSLQVRIDRIQVEKGSVDFEDHKPGEPPARIRLRDLDFEIGAIRSPLLPCRSPLFLKAKLEGPTREGNISVKGWVNIKTLDVDVSLNVRGVDLKLFEPYYRKKVTAEIVSGAIDMDSKVYMKEKKIDASGDLNLKHFSVREGSGTVFWIPAVTLVSLLEHKGNEMDVRFHVKGDMNDPDFNLREALLTQIGLRLVGALGLPVKIVEEVPLTQKKP